MKLDLSKYALVYAKGDTICGSETGIPAAEDAVLVGSIKELAKYKLVYVNTDFTAILGSETGIPTADDTLIYEASEETESDGTDDAEPVVEEPVVEEPVEEIVEEPVEEEDEPTAE